MQAGKSLRRDAMGSESSLMVFDIIGMNARNANTPACLPFNRCTFSSCSLLQKYVERTRNFCNSTEEFTDIISPGNTLISCLDVEVQ